MTEIDMIYKHNEFVVVTHTVDGRLIYIGTSRIGSAFETRIAEQSFAWRDAVNKSGGRVTIKVVEKFHTRHEAHRHAQDLRKALKPASWHSGTTRRGVRCLDTGKEYPSATEAALDAGMSKGAMSNHLNKRDGYETLRGLRFEWMDNASVRNNMEVALNGPRITWSAAPPVTDVNASLRPSMPTAPPVPLVNHGAPPQSTYDIDPDTWVPPKI